MHFLDLTIHEMHLALVAKQVTPKELVLEALKRAKNNQDQAFEMITETTALAQVASLGEPEVDNPFWGIPFVLKDNFSTQGLETTASSNILKGYIPLFDAKVYEKLRDAKAILIGKTTLDELAMGGSGTTGHLGKTYNPYDPSHERQVGGSSAGSASSVAAGIAPLGLGSDTGDSVRKPASYAGLVGFKPTWGLISRYGLFPFAPSLDHVGFFTRSVLDAALTQDLLQGHDIQDATSFSGPVKKNAPLLNGQVQGIKIAIIKEVMDAIVDAEIKEQFYVTVSKLKNLGATVEEISIPLTLLNAIYPTYITISCCEATSNNANLDGIKFGPGFPAKTYIEAMTQARTLGFSELIKRRFVIGSYALLKENQDVLFVRAQKARRMIVNALQKIYQQFDVIYLPASPTIAPKFTDAADRLSSTYLIADSHLALGNFAGLPSITLPIGLKQGFPYGANVMSRAYEDLTALNVALAIETMMGLKNLKAERKHL
jgi:aspartyl-tRNA(Asn)/glutamyl-tRNA(Gln) amidotransferase subunit A